MINAKLCSQRGGADPLWGQHIEGAVQQQADVEGNKIQKHVPQGQAYFLAIVDRS